MKVLDLFSGIGGFSLGLERAGMQTVAFCEIDEFCQQVLKKHWPGVPVYSDIRELKYNGAVDLICGGFPCQDLSVAGRQKGISGERSGLYGCMLDQICKFKPKWVIFENVSNLLNGCRGRWFSRFINDISQIGYDAQWHIISASTVGKAHKRARIWVIAYPSQVRPVLAQKIYNSIRNKIIQCKSHEKDMALCTEIAQLQFEDDVPDHRKFNGISQAAYRLGALGNAVVPQIPELIGHAIMEYEAML